MPRAYSLDLRERVVGLVTSGEPCRAVAELFDVSVASVVKWSQRARATGSAAAKPMGGKRPYLLEGERDWLLARLAEKPDLHLTLHALLAELGERGVVVSCDTQGSSSAKASASKKTVFAAGQDRPDIARRRAWWKRHQLKIDPARLLFIDETWAKTNMARTHGWWRRGFPLRAIELCRDHLQYRTRELAIETYLSEIDNGVEGTRIKSRRQPAQELFIWKWLEDCLLNPPPAFAGISYGPGPGCRQLGPFLLALPGFNAISRVPHWKLGPYFFWPTLKPFGIINGWHIDGRSTEIGWQTSLASIGTPQFFVPLVSHTRSILLGEGEGSYFLAAQKSARYRTLG